jgi:hypothetical protein
VVAAGGGTALGVVGADTTLAEAGTVGGDDDAEAEADGAIDALDAAVSDGAAGSSEAPLAEVDLAGTGSAGIAVALTVADAIGAELVVGVDGVASVAGGAFLESATKYTSAPRNATTARPKKMRRSIPFDVLRAGSLEGVGALAEETSDRRRFGAPVRVCAAAAGLDDDDGVRAPVTPGTRPPDTTAFVPALPPETSRSFASPARLFFFAFAIASCGSTPRSRRG